MLGQIVRVALYTGMRAGEIRSLRRGQINLARRVVTLTETKNGSARTVPLSNSAVAVLRTALANPVRPIDTDLVFRSWVERDRGLRLDMRAECLVAATLDEERPTRTADAEAFFVRRRP